ncbi:M28 family peptidase [Kordiimonas marina]|uniref:M28 family peptidase n=1 Tax=Kordiimonas marina TaxID=2872312 RepID=UPI001FF38D25|nr:M28 family peptidase [Kordiimonas marina]MCJ9427512.1 M28 family peptidase [Kordiimonas marina]
MTGKFATFAAMLMMGTTTAHADALTDLMPTAELKAVAAETSGALAKRNLDRITLYHRMRGSDQFNEAAQYVYDQLVAYGYDTAEILRFPADGKTMFGTQKSRPAWQVDFAELWEVKDEGGKEVRVHKLGDWAARPLTLAEDSDSADVSANLVDIGAGTADADYARKNIRGKIVLTSSQPDAVEALALQKYGAVGILSYAANQKTGWWKLDDSLVRWGHMSSFRGYKAFAFMTSLGEARKLQARLKAGESVRFHAKVEARREPGEYRIVTATIPGSDPKLKHEEIAFSCHLDHPRPGANDNASGCVAILEAARVLKRLVAEGTIPAPKRTIRFLWPAEIESTTVMLNARPDLAARIKHVIHMDMVGGNQATKSVFRVSRGPKSAADISGDIAWAITDFVNENTQAFADGEDTDFPLLSPEGTRNPQSALKEWISLGSDHDVFAAGSWRIPVTYLHDWPDIYIHTNKDVAANIDPTKLKRAAFIGVVQAEILATLTDADSAKLIALDRPAVVARASDLMAKARDYDAGDQAAASRGHWATEARITRSIKGYAPEADTKGLTTLASGMRKLTGIKEDTGVRVVPGPVYTHNPAIKGIMSVFGYSYLEDKLGADKVAKLTLMQADNGEEVSYEALNFVNGQRSVADIHDLLVAEFGPVPMDALKEYLAALASIGVVST